MVITSATKPTFFPPHPVTQTYNDGSRIFHKRGHQPVAKIISLLVFQNVPLFFQTTSPLLHPLDIPPMIPHTTAQLSFQRCIHYGRFIPVIWPSHLGNPRRNRIRPHPVIDSCARYRRVANRPSARHEIIDRLLLIIELPWYIAMSAIRLCKERREFLCLNASFTFDTNSYAVYPLVCDHSV